MTVKEQNQIDHVRSVFTSKAWSAKYRVWRTFPFDPAPLASYAETQIELETNLSFLERQFRQARFEVH